MVKFYFETAHQHAIQHYMENLTHIYATAYDFEADLRKQIEQDEHEKMLREAARRFAKKRGDPASALTTSTTLSPTI